VFISFSNIYLYLYSLKEHSGGDAIPLVLKTCAEFLEQEGILYCHTMASLMASGW